MILILKQWCVLKTGLAIHSGTIHQHLLLPFCASGGLFWRRNHEVLQLLGHSGPYFKELGRIATMKSDLWISSTALRLIPKHHWWSFSNKCPMMTCGTMRVWGIASSMPAEAGCCKFQRIGAPTCQLHCKALDTFPKMPIWNYTDLIFIELVRRAASWSWQKKRHLICTTAFSDSKGQDQEFAGFERFLSKKSC